MASKHPRMLGFCCTRGGSKQAGLIGVAPEELEETGLLPPKYAEQEQKRTGWSCCAKFLCCNCVTLVLLVASTGALLSFFLCGLPDLLPRGVDLDLFSAPVQRNDPREVCHSHGARHWKAPPPSTSCAARAWISQGALDRIGDRVGAVFNNRLEVVGSKFVDRVAGQSVTMYGLNATLQGVNIDRIQVDHVSLAFVEGQGVQMLVEGLAVSFGLDYSIVGERWMNLLDSAGAVSIGLGPATKVSAVMRLGVSDDGWFTVSLGGRPTIFFDFHLELDDGWSGGVLAVGAKLLFQLFFTTYKSCLEEAVSHVIETAVQGFVEKDVPDVLAGIPSLVGVGRHLRKHVQPKGAVDCLALLASVCSISVAADHMEIEASAEFVNVDVRKGIKRYDAPALPLPPTEANKIATNMVAVVANRWLIDSFVNVLEQSGKLAMKLFTLPGMELLEPWFGNIKIGLVLFINKPEIELREGEISAKIRPVQGTLWNLNDNIGFGGVRLDMEAKASVYVDACHTEEQSSHGKEIGERITVRNPQDCQVACRELPGCAVFSYRDSTGDCIFMENRQMVNFVKGSFVTGPASCADQSLDLELRKLRAGSLNLEGHTCRTLTNIPCQFPFVYWGETYHECTRVGNAAGLLWCATAVDDNRHMRDSWSWGTCGPICGEVHHAVEPLIQSAIDQKFTEMASEKLGKFSKPNTDAPMVLGNTSFRIQDGAVLAWSDFDLTLGDYLDEQVRIFTTALPTATYCHDGGESKPPYESAVRFPGAPVPKPTFTLTIQFRTEVTGEYQEIVSWGTGDHRGMEIELRLTPDGNLEYGENSAWRWLAFQAKPALELADDDWHSVAIIRNATGATTMHVDGDLVGHYTFPRRLPPNLKSGAASARMYQNRKDFVFEGDIGALHIFSSELNSDQLKKVSSMDECEDSTRSAYLMSLLKD